MRYAAVCYTHLAFYSHHRLVRASSCLSRRGLQRTRKTILGIADLRFAQFFDPVWNGAHAEKAGTVTCGTLRHNTNDNSTAFTLQQSKIGKVVGGFFLAWGWEQLASPLSERVVCRPVTRAQAVTDAAIDLCAEPRSSPRPNSISGRPLGWGFRLKTLARVLARTRADL